MAGIIFGLSTSESLERFSELAGFLLEVNSELTDRMLEKLRVKADELGIHQLDYNQTLWQAIQKKESMGHNFIINEQFIPIAVSCPRCDEELQEPTVRCPVCDWEFHFTCDDVSEEEAEAYWLKAQFATHLYQIKKYCKAAEQGDDQAQYHLGKAYCNGIGVEKDQAEGVRWYRMAAEQGNIDAQFVLGVLYSRGEGVGADNDEAIKWFRKAADQGDKSALNHLRRIEI